MPSGVKNKNYTPWSEGPDGRWIQYKNYIYVPYTNKHKSQIGDFGTQPPVAVA